MTKEMLNPTKISKEDKASAEVKEVCPEWEVWAACQEWEEPVDQVAWTSHK